MERLIYDSQLVRSLLLLHTLCHIYSNFIKLRHVVVRGVLRTRTSVQYTTPFWKRSKKSPFADVCTVRTYVRV